MTVNTPSAPHSSPAPLAPAAYHAPDVEAVVTLDELEREVHYAGIPASNVQID